MHITMDNALPYLSTMGHLWISGRDMITKEKNEGKLNYSKRKKIFEMKY